MTQFTSNGIFSAIRDSSVANTSTSLSEKEFYDFMVDIHKPSPKGTKRTMIIPLGWIRFKSGYGIDSLEIRNDDGETWRKPTEVETKEVQQFFNF